MNFMHFWPIGLGLVALAAPIAVHMLTKPKPVAFSLSTIRFLQEVIEQRKAKSRLRDWLILLLRTLCVALLAMALARPLLNSKPIVAVEPSKDAHRVLVIDVSQSMAAGSGGVTSWSAAQASALQFLQGSSGTQAAVVFAGAKGRPVFDRFSPNLNALREAIRQTKPRAERCDARSAFEEAAKILGHSNATTKELIVISDFQRNNWGNLLLDLIPQDTQVQFHSVAPKISDNVAITAVRFSSEPIVEQDASLEIDVANYSKNEVSVRCSLDMTDVQRTIEITLQPETTKTVVETLSFPAAGWKYGWARLQNQLDVLPADNERPVAVRVRPPVRIVMITRQNQQEIPSSSFYLQQAFDVVLGARVGSEKTPEPKTVSRIHPSRDAVRSWPNCDVFVLDHPGALSNDVLQYIASQIRRGKGLLYVTSELVDAVNLKQLQETLGTDFQPPVELTPDRELADRKELFVRQVKSRQTPFSVLGSNNAAALLSSVRFAGGLNTRANAEGLQDQVLAELSDTSALVYLTNVGAGQIAVINADLARSNWAIQPTFLPVLGELTQTLLAARGQRDQAAAGEPVVRMLPSEVEDTNNVSARTIEGPPPENDFGKWEFVATQSAVVWNWNDPQGSGIYSLVQNDAPVWMIATSAPGIESDLASLDEQVLTGRVSGTRKVGYSSISNEEKSSDDLWKWLITACWLGLVAEIAALRWTRM